MYPGTALQQAVTNSVHAAAGSWKSLSQSDRDSWEAYAKATQKRNVFGESRTLSGLNWFVGVNTRRSQAGFTPVSAAPIGGGLTPVNFLKIDADASANQISIFLDGNDPWANDNGGGLIVYVSQPQSVSINFFKGPYRLAATVVSTGIPPTSPALATPFSTTLTGFAGRKLFYRMIATMNDGRPSTEYRNFTIIQP